MSTVSWVYPQSVDELVTCLKNDTRPVGGATGLLRNRPRSGSLADLSAVGIGGISIQESIVRMGGAATYADTVSAIAATDPGHILVRALHDTASPALRNIITIGGSLALFPPWSRLVGPLVALDARLTLVGAAAGEYAVAEYVDDQKLKEQTAIVHVDASIGSEWEAYWYRFSPVRFNYPLCTVTVLTKSDGETISDSRIVITGNRGRFLRLEELEQSVVGKPRAAISVTPGDLQTQILGRQGFSAEYLTHLTAVEVKRALHGTGRSAA